MYVIFKNGERTHLESMFIQSLWRLASTWNREGKDVYTIEARG